MLLCAVRYAATRCPVCCYALSGMLPRAVRYAATRCPVLGMWFSVCSYALSSTGYVVCGTGFGSAVRVAVLTE
eukprot:2850974-Rhodomonas_salina.1